MNFPIAFENRMKTLLKTEFEPFLHALNQPEQKGIYVNSNKISTEDFKNIVDFEITQIPYEKNGFYVDNSKRGKHPLHHAGAFYVQDPSAMFTVNAYKFSGEEYVLDLCAAPGGKTIQLANRVQNGLVVSNEINKSRCEILYSNVERMGLKNVVVTNDTPKNLCSAYANGFDVVLVDAPCSGEGMFRRGQNVVDEWNENLPAMCAKRQLEILCVADKAVKKGGVIIYSTCTYSLEENEGVINSFLNLKNYELVNIEADLPRGIDMPKAVRLYPHKVKGEGQFVAVLKKLEENLLNPNKNLKLSINKHAEEFVNSNLKNIYNIYNYKTFSYLIKDLNMIKEGVNYLSPGVRVGETRVKVFLPNHYLFTALGREFKRMLNLNFSSLDAAKFLRGEVLETDFSDGYGAVLINNCPVGGFKISAGKFKNHYPKGLRNG